MKKELNEMCKQYLEMNGIKSKFFAAWIDCDYSRCLKWLNGERSIDRDQEDLAKRFIAGEYLTSASEL